MEAPEDRDLSRISCHGLEKGPDKHEEEEIVDDE
jgi:hypothetical protein